MDPDNAPRENDLASRSLVVPHEMRRECGGIDDALPGSLRRAQIWRGRQIGDSGRLPIEVVRGATIEETGICHYQIDSPPLVPDLLEKVGLRVVGGDVALDERDSFPLRVDLFGDCFAVTSPASRDCDLVALLEQLVCDVETDSALQSNISISA